MSKTRGLEAADNMFGSRTYLYSKSSLINFLMIRIKILLNIQAVITVIDKARIYFEFLK